MKFRFFFKFLLILFIFISDIYTKFIVESYFSNNYEKIEVSEFLNIVYTKNTGISFGLFSSLNYSNLIFLVIAVSILLYLLYWIRHEIDVYNIFCIALISGGAMGNIYDRIQKNAVTDFIEFHYLGYYFPAFNIADASISTGVVLFIVKAIFTNEEMNK